MVKLAVILSLILSKNFKKITQRKNTVRNTNSCQAILYKSTIQKIQAPAESSREFQHSDFLSYKEKDAPIFKAKL